MMLDCIKRGRTIYKKQMEKMMKFDRIQINPARMNGQPCIRDLRITVRRVLELLAIYPNRAELLQEFPELEEADIQQALAFAATYLDDRVIEMAS